MFRVKKVEKAIKFYQSLPTTFDIQELVVDKAKCKANHQLYELASIITYSERLKNYEFISKSVSFLYCLIIEIGKEMERNISR